MEKDITAPTYRLGGITVEDNGRSQRFSLGIINVSDVALFPATLSFTAVNGNGEKRVVLKIPKYIERTGGFAGKQSRAIVFSVRGEPWHLHSLFLDEGAVYGCAMLLREPQRSDDPHTTSEVVVQTPSWKVFGGSKGPK